MDLQISVFLLFILFTAGHSFECYGCTSLTGSCTDQTVQTCPSGSSQCESTTVVTQVGDFTSEMKYKACALACQSMSMNVGIVRTTTSCCNTNLCNLQDPPDPAPNGKKCFYCDRKSCSNTVSCSGTEDHCIKATGSFVGQSVVLKGCVSKSFCDTMSSVRNIESISCCEGNLCNGAQSVTQSSTYNSAQSVTQSSTYNSAQSVTQSSTYNSAQSITQNSTYNSAQSITQSFLFLCCSLLSYFLLH